MSKNNQTKDKIQSDGTFKRQQSQFANQFGNGENELPIEPNRYRLIWSKACPWSHRAIISLKLLGLDEVISVGEVDPFRPNVPRIDWAFTLDKDNVDPILKVEYLSELYQNADPSYVGRPTVPAIVDVDTRKVVNNDYFTLTIDFATVWNQYHHEHAPNLYPEQLRNEIDRLNEVIYSDVNNGVYQCGFARSQQAYEKAYDKVFSRLESLEKRLENKRFLLGDYITEADIRLYVTLARFDVAYYSYFKANKKCIIDYPNLWGYVRDLYEESAFRDTTDFISIKNHYYTSAKLTPTEEEQVIIPKGPDLSGWYIKSDRQLLSNVESKFL